MNEVPLIEELFSRDRACYEESPGLPVPAFKDCARHSGGCP